METEEKALSAMLEETFDFDIPYKGIFGKSRVKSFTISPLNLGSLIRISKILLSIEEIDWSRPYMDVGPEVISKYAERLCEIVAIAVTNGPKPPQKRLVKFFVNNLTASELYRLIELVKGKMDVSSFLLCIVSAKGMSLLQTSAEAKESPSISGTQSAAS